MKCGLKINFKTSFMYMRIQPHWSRRSTCVTNDHEISGSIAGTLTILNVD